MRLQGYIQGCGLQEAESAISSAVQIVYLSEVEMYYFYDKVNWGHVVCPLHRGCPYLGESIMGGSTVLKIA